MAVVLIILAYLVIAIFEIASFRRAKIKRKEIVLYVVFMAISLAISLVITTNEDLPSIASIILKIFSPIVGK
jgi:hypothetical protein